MSKKEKRLKVSYQKPNPLFEKWLTEWRDEAALKNSNLQYCYSKALKSLKKYPLPLKTGKDCLILENFGHGLCGKLQKKLEDHLKTHPSHGTDDPPDILAPSSAFATSNRQKADKPPKKRKLNEDKASPSSPPVNKKQKTYVPAYRSGGYALLVTLFRSQREESYPGFMTKAQLQKSAQPLCDSSFYKPDPGSYYTAWSSMATLIKKALVSKTGQPAKFSLTNEGTKLAGQLEEADSPATSGCAPISKEDQLKPQPHTYRASPRSKINSKRKKSPKQRLSTLNIYLSDEDDPDAPDAVAAPLSPQIKVCSPKKTQDFSRSLSNENLSSAIRKTSHSPNWYNFSDLDDNFASTSQNFNGNSMRHVKNVGSSPEKITAYISLESDSDDSDGKQSKPSPLQNTRSHCKPSKSQDRKWHELSDTEDEPVTAETSYPSLSDDEAGLDRKPSRGSGEDGSSMVFESCNTISKRLQANDDKMASSTASKRQPLKKKDVDVDMGKIGSPLKSIQTISEVPYSCSTKRSVSPCDQAPKSVPDLYFGADDDDDYLMSQIYCNSPRSPESKEKSSDLHKEPHQSTGQSSSIASCKFSNTSSSPKKCSDSSQSSSQTSDCVILVPDTFDIILLVDEQESTNRSKPFLLALENSEVNFEVRHLKVGDYVWIARCKATKAEVVLPYIVERKRMDDLGSSIKDGRFHEQKVRLKQSGIEKLIYLVETYGGNYGLPETTVHQAAVNTYVVDCFQLKYTSDYRHSASYLATLTRLIRKQFKDKTIASCDKNTLPPFQVDSDFVSLMTFKDFAKGMSKVRNYSVKEMFIKHLLQLSGMSVEKAIAITNKFPTPKSLLSAYENGGREDMLASITFGPTKRTIGPALSKSVFQLYTSKSFP